VKNKNRPATAEKEKTMKLEESKNKTNEAVSYLVAALESGQSDVLTQYLNAMARFHNYSFDNIMLIARRLGKPDAGRTTRHPPPPWTRLRLEAQSNTPRAAMRQLAGS
jgi:hypothetical protein